MSAATHFAPDLLAQLSEAGTLRIRAGDTHRYTVVWVVVVRGRAFVRTWDDAATGWFRAFRAVRRGSIRLGDRTIPVAGRVVRGTALQRAVTRAYAEKYDSPGSLKWVRGFAERSRERNTLELLPAARTSVNRAASKAHTSMREAR